MTATIDGAQWNAISASVIAIKHPATAGLSNGTVGVSGTSSFTNPILIMALAVPAAVGTYSLGPATSGPLNVSTASLQNTSAAAMWEAGAFTGSGAITLSTLTATGATGTFSFNLVPLSGTTATGTKVVTNGVFNVRF
jgi:hypothetical protein